MFEGKEVKHRNLVCGYSVFIMKTEQAHICLIQRSFTIEHLLCDKCIPDTAYKTINKTDKNPYPEGASWSRCIIHI